MSTKYFNSLNEIFEKDHFVVGNPYNDDIVIKTLINKLLIREYATCEQRATPTSLEKCYN